MGCGMNFLMYLKNKEILQKDRCRILDFGTSCLVGATQETCREFLQYFLGDAVRDVDQSAIDKVVNSSVVVTGIRTAYLYELLELVPQIEYLAFDIAPNLKTMPFDLNGQVINKNMRGYYDVVLNFGTTEHVVNQFHSFKTIHDLLAVGGIAYNQVPSIGYSDHGYFAYEPKFFQHLAEANGYEIVDMWLTPTGGSAFPPIDVRDYGQESASPGSAVSDQTPTMLKWYVLNVAYKKTSADTFRLGLDTQVLQSELYQDTVAGKYWKASAPGWMSGVKSLLKYDRSKSR
jgi:hypothetical protein